MASGAGKLESRECLLRPWRFKGGNQIWWTTTEGNRSEHWFVSMAATERSRVSSVLGEIEGPRAVGKRVVLNVAGPVLLGGSTSREDLSNRGAGSATHALPSRAAKHTLMQLERCKDKGAYPTTVHAEEKKKRRLLSIIIKRHRW